MQGCRELYKMSSQPMVGPFVETITRVNSLLQDSNFRCVSFLHNSTGAMKKLCMETIKHQEDYIEEPPGGRNFTRECADLIKLNQKIQMKHKKVEKMMKELIEKKQGARAIMKKLNNGDKEEENSNEEEEKIPSENSDEEEEEEYREELLYVKANGEKVPLTQENQDSEIEEEGEEEIKQSQETIPDGLFN